MSKYKTYTFSGKKWCMFIPVFSFELILLLIFLLLKPSLGVSQEEPQYDEVTVSLKVQGIGKADIPALIKDGKAYLSISDVFNLLKIKNSPSSRLDSLSGFFINPQDEYLIDRVRKQIIFQGKKIDLKSDDLILTELNLYMKTSLFGDVFGLVCIFNTRNLSVALTTQLELPLIREMKLEQMRNNIKRLNGEVKTDTTIKRSYPLFKFGIADWAIATMQQQRNSPNTQLNLSLGSVVAGGELNVGLNYNQITGYDPRDQNYLWRYANNDFKALRQVSIGKMIPQTISTLNGSLLGVQFTNTPTIYRKSFGSYTLSNVTEPGWQVELYVNNVLIDYVKADASGFYKFEVPLVYGLSILKVRMYGPWGEVREKIENANIPFNFLPKGEFEYSVNAGVVEDQPNTRLYRSNVNYGVNRKMSVGGGYEYFSSPTVTNSLPFVNSSVTLINDLLFSGEYTFGVRLKSSLSYRTKSNIQLDLNYTGYEKGQNAVPYSPLKMSGVAIALPIQGKHFFSYSRLSLDQIIYSDFKVTNASFLFSSNFNGVSSNITTTAQYLDPKHINTTSNISFSYRFPGKFNFIPSVKYDYNREQLTLMRINLQKPLIGNGFLTLTYERNLIDRTNSFDVGIRYDFSFMQTELASHLSKNSNSFSQSARGSLFFDRKNHYTEASKTSLLGNGGFTFLAFLDLNGNGKRDKSEPKVNGLNVRVNGGRIMKSEKDSTTRVIDLPPYTSYLVELDKNSFKSLSWRINKLNLNVYADPNQFKLIEIPVEVVAEATGTVTLKTKNGTRGLGRVYVNFYRNGQTQVAKVLTEEDGYFSYMGLLPGEYVARMDSSQMKKIRMAATPEFKNFTVKQSKEGDFVEGLDFTLVSTAKDTTEGAQPKVEPKVVQPETKIINYASVDGKKGVAEGESKTDLKTEVNIPGVRYSQNIPGKDSKKPNPVKNISGTDSKKTAPVKVIPNEDTKNLVNNKNELIADNKVETKTITEPVKVNKDQNIVGKDQKDVITPPSGVRYSQPIPAKNKPDATIIRATARFAQSQAEDEQRCSIQYGSYKSEADALSDQKNITTLTGLPVVIVLEDKVYKLWIEGFNNRREAKAFLASLDKSENWIKGDRTILAMNQTNMDKVEPAPVSKIKSEPVKNDKIVDSGRDQLVDYTDSIAKIFTFEPEGSKTRGYPINNKTNPTINPIVNQDSQLIVADGQQFSIQIDGFIFAKSASAALRRIATATKLPMIISIRNGFYNLLIEGFASRKDARLFQEKLVLMGFKGTIVKGKS